MFCCNWVCRLDLYSARPRPNHCQMVDRVPASGDIYEACGRLEVEGRRGGGGGGGGGGPGLEIHPRRLSFVVWERVRWKIGSEWWRISGQPADFIWLFCEAPAMLNVCVGLLFQFRITHIFIVDGEGNSCYCTDAPDIVFHRLHRLCRRIRWRVCLVREVQELLKRICEI